ncbi:MAG: PDZ domain-containing protein [Pseudomonadota bacterium]
MRGQAVGLALLLLLGMGISSPSLAGEDPPDMEGMDDRAFKQRLREAEAELDAAARKLREVYQTRFTGKERPRKAMLGVLVDYGKRDDGVPLTGLTPGGGAEAAGLRARDVLISVNGVRLDDPDDGRSSMKALTQEMDKVAPGEEVLIGYRRRGNVAETTVTTRARQKDLNALLDSLDVDVDIDFDELGDEIAEAAESVAMSALALASQTPKAPQPPAAPAAPVDGLKQLAALTEGLTVSSTPDRFIDLDPDLAAYFGVEDGVLAVGMDGNGDGLKSGDVVLSLGGEPATDAASARAFLNAAQGSVPAEVLRKGETRVLELDSDRYQSDRRVSVIRISQDGDNVEVTIDADDD